MNRWIYSVWSPELTIYSRVDEAQNEINDLEHKEIKTTSKDNKKKKLSPPPKKNEDSISSHWDNFNRYNIHPIGVPEEEEKEQEIYLRKKMKENFPNLVKEIDMQI